MMKSLLFVALLSAVTAIGACDGSTIVLGGTGTGAGAAASTSGYPWDMTTSGVTTGSPGETTSTGATGYPWDTTTGVTTGGYGGDTSQSGTGTSPYTGTGGGPVIGPGLTCAGLFSPSPFTSTWNTALTKADFEPGSSYQDYAALNTCVCETKLADQGCADLCTAALDGTSKPNWCDGEGATDVCDMCLNYWCAAQFDACITD